MVVPRGEELYELQDEQDGRLEHNDNDEQEEGTANGPDPEEPAEKEVKDAAVPVLSEDIFGPEAQLQHDLELELLLDLQTDYSQADFGTNRVVV